MIAYESMREKGVEGYCSKGKTIDYIFIIVLISFQLFILCTDPTRSSAFPFLSERNLYIFPVYYLKSEKCGSRGGKLFTVSRM